LKSNALPTVEDSQLHDSTLREYRELEDKVFDAVISTTLDWTITSWSRSAERIYGYPAKTVIGCSYLEIVSPQYQEITDKNMMNQLSNEGYWMGEVMQKHHDGTRIIAYSSISFIRDLNENHVGLLVINRDITSQKQLEQELRSAKDQLERLVQVRTQRLLQREHQLHAQYQGIPIPVLTWQRQNDDFVLIDYNDANAQLTQGKIKEYLNVTARTFFQGKPEMVQDLERCYTQQTTFKRERFYTFVTTGETKYLALTFNYTPPDLVLIHSEDITERRALESALQASEERYRSLFLSAREGIIISNAKGTIQAANPAATRILGYRTVAELEAIPIQEIYFDVEKHRVVNQQLIQKGFLDNIEVELKHKEGHAIDVQTSIILRKDPSGAVTQIESIFTDISGRKQRERALRRQLTQYQVEEGNIYLDKNDVPTLAYAAFQDLINAGYKGVAISRTVEEELKRMISEAFTYYHLAEEGVNPLLPKVDILHQIVNKHARHTVFLFDRLDYLNLHWGFYELLRFLYWLRDTLYLMGNISIIVADPTSFSERQLHILEKETHPITVRHPEIPRELLDILQFVYRQNGFGVQPKYSDVQKHLGVSKPTASKRIQQLVDHGYIQEYVRGNRKCLQLSFAGVHLINQS
jgi:PAS domain S-box-containing protein